MASQRVTFLPGQVVARKNYRGPHVSWMQATTVVRDDSCGLALWLPVGADFEFRLGPDGGMLRTGAVEEFGAAPLIRQHWRDADVLMWHPPGQAHSVWWFFRDGRFRHWYVNLESPYTRGRGWIANVDHHLDIVVDSDRSWQWKDEQDLDEATGMPGFWTVDQAAQIREEGRRVIATAESGAFPFDGTWCNFQPHPRWRIPRLPKANKPADASGPHSAPSGS